MALLYAGAYPATHDYAHATKEDQDEKQHRNIDSSAHAKPNQKSERRDDPTKRKN